MMCFLLVSFGIAIKGMGIVTEIILFKLTYCVYKARFINTVIMVFAALLRQYNNAAVSTNKIAKVIFCSSVYLSHKVFLLGCISHRFEIAIRELKLDEELLNLLLYLLGFGVAFGLSHPLVKLANGMKCILEFYRSIVPILKAVYFVDEQSSFT